MHFSYVILDIGVKLEPPSNGKTTDVATSDAETNNYEPSDKERTDDGGMVYLFIH